MSSLSCPIRTTQPLKVAQTVIMQSQRGAACTAAPRPIPDYEHILFWCLGNARGLRRARRRCRDGLARSSRHPRGSRRTGGAENAGGKGGAATGAHLGCRIAFLAARRAGFLDLNRRRSEAHRNPPSSLPGAVAARRISLPKRHRHPRRRRVGTNIQDPCQPADG